MTGETNLEQPVQKNVMLLRHTSRTQPKRDQREPDLGNRPNEKPLFPQTVAIKPSNAVQINRCMGVLQGPRRASRFTAAAGVR